MISRLFRSGTLFLLLGASYASAQEVSASFRDFSGGINDNTATIALKPNESPDALNVVIDEPWGNIKTRNGSLTCGTTPSGNKVTNAYEYIRSNGNHDLILTDNITVWATQDCVEFSTIATGLNQIASPYFDTFRDKLWIVNKSTHIITWDGTTANLLDGVGTRPNPPLAQYITHWKERVWVARTTTEPSAIYFSALTDSDGVNIDPSVSSQAWPSANAFYIAQEDGSPIYGIKVYKDNLFVFKETGIWRILFESVYNTQVVKAVSNVGCKFQDSIIELDNFLYFVGKDGIYKFDGNDVVRISDNITTTFKRLKQPSRLDKFQLWDSATDFGTGTNTNTSLIYPPGTVSLDADISSRPFDNGTSSATWTFSIGTNLFTSGPTSIFGKTLYYNYGAGTREGELYKSSTTVNWGNWQIKQMGSVKNGSYGGHAEWFFVSDSTVSTNSTGYSVVVGCPGGSSTCQTYLYKNVNGVQTIVDTNAGAGSSLYCATMTISISYDGVITTSGTAIISGIPTPASTLCNLSYTDTTFIPGSSKYQIFRAENYAEPVFFGGIDIPGGYLPSGTYYSEISTFTNLTQWRTFDVDDTLNGHSINYYVRTATSAYNLGLASYRSITSGAQISTNTAHKNFQWKADFATTDTSVTPLLNAITANYVEGDASESRLMAVNYNNRYMLTGSTTMANTFNDIVLVKTKSPLDNWMVYDWKISAFTRWNDNLYGGVANTSGISRYDYGTSDNGSAINAYWTWGDTHFGNLSIKKTLSELYLYYIPSLGANTLMQYSRDGGANWNSLSAPLNTTGAFGTKRLLFNGGNANAFRFRVLNNTLDESFNFLGFDAFGTPYKYRE